MAAANGTTTAAVGDITLTTELRLTGQMPVAIRETITYHVVDTLTTDVILAADVAQRFARPAVSLFDPEDEAAPASLRTDELLEERFPSFEDTIAELKDVVTSEYCTVYGF